MGRLENSTKAMIRRWAKKHDLFIFSYNPYMGGRPGIPDFILIIGGYFVGIEAKSDTGKCSKLQLEMHRQIRDHDGFVYVVRNREDLENIETDFKL